MKEKRKRKRNGFLSKYPREIVLSPATLRTKQALAAEECLLIS